MSPLKRLLIFVGLREAPPVPVPLRVRVATPETPSRLLAPQHSPDRRPWTASPVPVDSESTGGYGGGGDAPAPAAEPDEPVVVEGLPLPIEVQFPPLPKSAEPGTGPTFVYDDPPPAYCRLALRDDRTELSGQRFVPPSQLSDSDHATDAAPYTPGWAPGSRQGIPQYPDWQAGR